MGRYSKSHSNYVLRKRYMNAAGGVIYERDWLTLGERHVFEPGKRPVYYSGNFVFSDNSRINTLKRHKFSKFIASWNYDDVKDAKGTSNKVSLNTRTNDLRDFAYYGSCREAVRVALLNIINQFPGQIKTLSTPLVEPGEGGEQTIYALYNPFEIDLVHKYPELTAYDNPLRFLGLKWDKYTLNENQITGYKVDIHFVDEVCMPNNEGKEVITITIKSADTSSGDEIETVLYGYYLDGAVRYGATEDIVIRPTTETINDYFDNLYGLERMLLNRHSKPRYSNRLITPIEKIDKNGYAYVLRTYTWPSDEYCITIDTPQYYSFAESLYRTAEIFDETWCDNLYGKMTHEAIKNFDWTYTRTYSEGEEADYTEGGDLMADLLRLYGRMFDDLKWAIDGIRQTGKITYDGFNNITDAELTDKLELKGWDVTSTIPALRYGPDGEDSPTPQSETSIDAEAIDRFAKDTKGGIEIFLQDTVSPDNIPYGTRTRISPHDKWFAAISNDIYTANEADIEFMRELMLSSKKILQSKGTLSSIEMVFALFGLGRGVDYDLGEGYKETVPKKLYQDTDGYWPCVDASRNLTAILRYGTTDTHEAAEDPYNGIPLGELKYKNRDYLIPKMEAGKNYIGNEMFQSNGGWARHGWVDADFVYTETLSYLKTVSNILDLYNLNPRSLNVGDVYYVYDLVATTDGEVMPDTEDEIPSSHFFGLLNDARPDLPESWKEIIMDPESPDFDEDSELYQRASYLDSIMSVNTGNNPHVGYGNYDMGSTYDGYMSNPFSDITANSSMDEALIDIINSTDDSGYTFPIDRYGALDIETEGDSDSKGESKYAVKKIRSASEGEDGEGRLKKYFLNDKILVIKNLHGRNDTYNEYFFNVIFPYISQVIPSTTMLLLEGFDAE